MAYYGSNLRSFDDQTIFDFMETVLQGKQIIAKISERKIESINWLFQEFQQNIELENFT